MKIRSRLALYGAGLAGVGVFLFTLAFTSLISANAIEEQDKTLGEVATDTASSLTAIPEGAPAIRVDPATTSEIFVVIVADGVATYSEARGQAPELADGLVDWDGRQFRSRGAELAGGTVFALQGADFVDQQAEGLRLAVLLATAITALAAMVISWFVSGRALRPLRQLADTTNAIGTGANLETRLPIGKADDEVRRLSVSFNSMLDRLQSALRSADSALEAQRTFVADSSHDLRTPLTTIRASAGFLLDRTDATPEDRSEAVADISAEADRMAEMLDKLGLLASADADHPVRMETVDIAALAMNAASRASRVSDRQVTAHGLEALDVEADSMNIERALWVLIENALMHGDGPVQVGVAQNDDLVRVSVRDQGPGIQEVNRARVFDRFYREETSRTSEGSGLGLAIVKSIIEQHGGTVEARNLRPGFEVAFQFPVSSGSHL